MEEFGQELQDRWARAELGELGSTAAYSDLSPSHKTEHRILTQANHSEEQTPLSDSSMKNLADRRQAENNDYPGANNAASTESPTSSTTQN